MNGEELLSTGRAKLAVKRAEHIPFVFVKTVPAQGNGIKRVENMGLFYKNLFPAAKAYSKRYGTPDIIIASSVHPLTMVAGIQIARKMRIPCICEIRDLWPEAIFSFGKTTENSIIGKMLIKGEHWIYKNADALIFTKEGDTDYLKEKRWTTAQGGDIDLMKCHYINNGVDIEAFERNIQTEKPDDQDLFVGNLLDTAALIKSRPGYEDVQFLIYGDGGQLEELRTRIRDEKLDNVKMKGFIDRKYIPYILNHSALNMLNYSQSQYNWTRGNSSNKLFEYMASGKPVISTVHMGYSIINKYQCGVELDEDTPEALCKQIMRFHDMGEDERARIGQNARTGAQDFDFDVLTQNLINVIESVV